MRGVGRERGAARRRAPLRTTRGGDAGRRPLRPPAPRDAVPGVGYGAPAPPIPPGEARNERARGAGHAAGIRLEVRRAAAVRRRPERRGPRVGDAARGPETATPPAPPGRRPRRWADRRAEAKP